MLEPSDGDLATFDARADMLLLAWPPAKKSGLVQHLWRRRAEWISLAALALAILALCA